MISCTNLLSTCSQIYSEAIEVLHHFSDGIVLDIDGAGRRLLRDPFDFGKPGYFKALSQASISGANSQTFDELQVIRMRKVVLDLCFPTKVPFGQVVDNIDEIAIATGKSHSIEIVIVRPERGFGRNVPLASRDRVKEALCSLIQALKTCGCKLVVDTINFRDDSRDLPKNKADKMSGSLISWFVGVALDSGVDLEIAMPVVKKDANGPHNGQTPHGLFDDGHPGNHPESQDVVVFDHAGLRASPAATLKREKITFFRPALPGVLCQESNFIPSCIRPYGLTPECRHCLTPFRDWRDLSNHLTTKPDHQMKFIKKTFNELHPDTYHGTASQRCWTCSLELDTKKSLQEHLAQENHYRYGKVPKYVEDNEEWNRRWIQRFHEWKARLGDDEDNYDG